MTHETLKWKLFHFSLIESARQWYTSNIRCANRDQNDLRDWFCLAFFPLSRICTLRAEILTFHQNEKESIGVAWARLSFLVQSGPDLSLPNHLLLQHLYTGLSKDNAHYLDPPQKVRSHTRPQLKEGKSSTKSWKIHPLSASVSLLG
jgi:hypothetical protein